MKSDREREREREREKKKKKKMMMMMMMMMHACMHALVACWNILYVATSSL